MKTLLLFLLMLSSVVATAPPASAQTINGFARRGFARMPPPSLSQVETTKLDANGDTLLLVEQSMSRPEAYRPEITQDRWVSKKDYEDGLPVFINRGQLNAILRRLEQLEVSISPEKSPVTTP